MRERKLQHTRLTLLTDLFTQQLRLPLLKAGLDTTVWALPLRTLGDIPLDTVLLLDLVGLSGADVVISLDTLASTPRMAPILARVAAADFLSQRLLSVLPTCYAVADEHVGASDLAFLARYPIQAEETPLLLGAITSLPSPVLSSAQPLHVLRCCLEQPTFEVVADACGLGRAGLYKVIRQLRVLAHYDPENRWLSPRAFANAVIAAFSRSEPYIGGDSPRVPR